MPVYAKEVEAGAARGHILLSAHGNPDMFPHKCQLSTHLPCVENLLSNDVG